MQKILLVFAILILSLGCASRHLGDTKPPVAELPNTIQFSANYRMFWMELVELSQGKPINKIKPSKQMMENYNIKKIDGYYIISGFIIVSDTFDVESLKKLGVELNPFSLTGPITSSAYSYRAPISVMPKVYEVKGIESIELSQRVFLKTHTKK
ncbi:hypothetical protein N9251_02650 [Gammaproteobacteria bacterium]|nr:hypothetical protein [Gammaproteobacteria bacterium]